MANFTVQDIEQAYIVYFGRAAEPTGLANWMQYSSITPLSNVYAEFSHQPEYLSLYGSYFNAQGFVANATAANALLDAAYLNLFGRTADQGGKDFWGAKLVSHALTIADVIFAVSQGATGSDLDSINAKVVAAIAYTNHFTTNNPQFPNGGFVGTSSFSWLQGITSYATEASAVATLNGTSAGNVVPWLATQTEYVLGSGDIIYGNSTNYVPGDHIHGNGGNYGTVDITLTGQTVTGLAIDNVSNIIIHADGANGANTIVGSRWSNIDPIIADTVTGTLNITDLQQATNDWYTAGSTPSTHGVTYGIIDAVDTAGVIHLNFDAQAVDNSLPAGLRGDGVLQAAHTGPTEVDLSVQQVSTKLVLDGGNIEILHLHIADPLDNLYHSKIANLHVQGITTLTIDDANNAGGSVGFVGGYAGNDFSIETPLDASLKVIDAHSALPNLTLDISNKSDESPILVTLGLGNDTLKTGDSLGVLGYEDTIHGGLGKDKLTAVFATVGTRNPTADGIETFDLTFHNSASVDFQNVYDLTTINVLESTYSAKLFNIHPSVHNINLTDAQTGPWVIAYQQGSAGGVNGIPEAQYGDLTLTWTDNSSASNLLTQLGGDQFTGFHNVQKLTFVKDGFQDDFVNNFSVDSYITQKLHFSVIGDGLLDVEGYKQPKFTDIRYINSSAVEDLGFYTNSPVNHLNFNSNGDLYVAFANEGSNLGQGVIDAHSTITIDVEAGNRGNIGLGNLLFGSTLQTVKILSAGANIDVFSIQGKDQAEYLAHPGEALPTADLNSTVSYFNVGSTSSSAVYNHIAIGEIVAEDISYFTANAALHTTINLSALTIDNSLDPSLDGGTTITPVAAPGIWFTNHGDTFTGSGLGTILPIQFGDGLGTGATGQEAFSTFDFSGLKNAHDISGVGTNPAWLTAPFYNGGFDATKYGIAVNFESAHNDVNFTGTSNNDLVIAGLGNNTISTGAGKDYVLINPASTGNNVISTGAGIDTVVLSSAAPGAHGRDIVTEPGTNVNLVSSPVVDGTIDTIVNFNQLTDRISFGPNGGVAGTTGNTHLAGAAVLDYAAALVAADGNFIANTHLVYDFEYVSATEGFLFQHNTIVPATETVIHLVGLNPVNPFGAANIIA